MRLLALLSIAPFALSAPCIPVDRDRIVAADVAMEFVAFRQLDPNLVIGMAPVPGTHRTFSGHELAAIARQNGIRLDGLAPDVCFERGLTLLTVERIRAAMLSSLGSQNARIEVVDFTRQPMPSGELDFPRNSLTAPPVTRQEATVFWRGTVRYSPQHTLAVWANVRILEERPVVVAVHGIRSGAVISPEDVALIRRDIFPFAPHLETQAGALGRRTRKTIPAGSLMGRINLTSNTSKNPPWPRMGTTIGALLNPA